MTIAKINTVLDEILDYVKGAASQQNSFSTVSEIAKALGRKRRDIEFWAEFLEKQKMLEVSYPTNIFSTPRARLIPKEGKKEKSTIFEEKNKELVQEYDVESDNLTVTVRIWRSPSEDVPIYEMILPEMGEGTQALLNGIFHELAKKTPATIEDVTDIKKIKAINKEHLKDIALEINSMIPEAGKEVIVSLASTLLHQMYGLGRIELILSDESLEEIAINGSNEPISVYHKQFGWLKTLIYISSEDEIFNLSAQIGRKSGQEINYLNPIMDAHLLSGDRVASTLYPVSAHGNTITIRKFAKKPWTITQFLEPKVKLMSKEIAAFVWMVMQYELNVLIVGGTASGKTSMLNVLCSLMPPKNRIISVEDTRELMLPETLNWNWVPLACKSPNPEGKGGVTMLDLTIAALRMRPDRIVVGEIRRSEQAQALFEAMHTGHSVYATMHADTSEQVMRRLLEPPIQISKTELCSLHLITVQFRDRKTGRRRAKEIVEIIDSGEDIELNHLFRWNPRTDVFEKVNSSRRIYENLSLYTGLTIKDIEDNLRKKEAVLQWIVENNADDVNLVGQIMRVYYNDEAFLLDCIKSKMDVKEMLVEFEKIVREKKIIDDTTKEKGVEKSQGLKKAEPKANAVKSSGKAGTEKKRHVRILDAMKKKASAKKLWKNKRR